MTGYRKDLDQIRVVCLFEWESSSSYACVCTVHVMVRSTGHMMRIQVKIWSFKIVSKIKKNMCLKLFRVKKKSDVNNMRELYLYKKRFLIEPFPFPIACFFLYKRYAYDSYTYVYVLVYVAHTCTMKKGYRFPWDVIYMPYTWTDHKLPRFCCAYVLSREIFFQLVW